MHDVIAFLCRFCQCKFSSVPICLDLAYLPSGSAASTVDVEFFRRLRSSCYIISGDEPHKETVMRSILNSLLEGKASWPDVQVSRCFIYLYHLSQAQGAKMKSFPKMKVLSNVYAHSTRQVSTEVEIHINNR